MAQGIYIYTEIQDGKTGAYTTELCTLAGELQTEEEIQVFGLKGNDIFDEEYAAQAVADYIRKKDPRIVLIPATGTAKAIFARTAVLLDVGMTADCTELSMENGVFSQKKPAFGKEAMAVTQSTEEPALVTVVVGNQTDGERYPVEQTDILAVDRSSSNVQMIGMTEQEVGEITDAPMLLALGRGVMGEQGMEAANALAEKLGAAIGGTRPLADQGILPFEHQIGQTGCVVHPKFCLFVGVSGAVQHTEGVRDSNITIAVNPDPNAAIFSFADYGILADGIEFMNALRKRV